MRKTLKISLSILGVVVILLIFAGLIIHKPRPEGVSGPRAEALTDSMLKAINYEAYDTLHRISWSYPKGHHFDWWLLLKPGIPELNALL